MRTEIYCEDGSVYEFDPVTELVYKDGVIVSGAKFEPIYLPERTDPILTGLFMPETNQILLKSGRIVNNSKSVTINI